MATSTIDYGRVKGTFWYTGAATDSAGIKGDLSGMGITALDGDFYVNTAGKIFTYSKASDAWTQFFDMRSVYKGGTLISIGDDGSINNSYYEYDNIRMSIFYITASLDGLFALVSGDTIDFGQGALKSRLDAIPSQTYDIWSKFREISCRSSISGSNLKYDFLIEVKS